MQADVARHVQRSLVAWAGLDGFIDKIVIPVQVRIGAGNTFVPYATLDDLGQKISQASQNNFNLELFPKTEKMGGNGPLLAHALARMGVNVHYVGTLGQPIHPLFQSFSKETHATSIGPYGESIAIECQDGKLILGITHAMETVTYERLCEYISEAQLIKNFNEADLIAWQNWTMLIHLTDILEKILEHIWPHVKPKQGRITFFDLADPAKRPKKDVSDLLRLLKRFNGNSNVYLALNRSEAQYVGCLVNLPYPHKALDTDPCKQWLKKLRSMLGIEGIILHCRDGALGINSQQLAFAPPHKPKRIQCLTGSGDHFNAGCLYGLLTHLSLEQSLNLGHSIAVHYIETGTAPSIDEIKNNG